MKASDLRGQSDEQLVLTLRETEKHLFQLRFQSATDRLETPSEIRKARKDIARVLTEQRRRELEKLGQSSDEQLVALVAGLGPKVAGGPGKRKAKREFARLARLQEGRAAATAKAARVAKHPAQPAKGK